MEKLRRTFWLADEVTPRHRELALQLQQKGFDIHFFSSLDAIHHELTTKRAAVVVLSDDGGGFAERALMNLMNIPETQGARLILTVSRHAQRIGELAAAANVRDIIPFDLDDRQWLARFTFATAGRAVPFVQPAAQITMNNISSAVLPARLTWIDGERLRIECRLRPPAGASLQLGGAFAAALGVAHVTLTVEETQRSNLLFRFSDALICRWSVPSAARDKATATLLALKEQDPGPRCRVFVVARSPTLRAAILTRFEDPRFEVSAALQKQSIVEEPRYFTPDVVFIEDALALDEEGRRFDQMMANLADSATVVVIGRVPDLRALQRRHPGRKVILLPRLPKTIGQSILARHLPPAKRAVEKAASIGLIGGAHLLAEHQFSLAEVSCPARLTRLHPLAAQIALPFPVSNFALLRVESPVFRRMIGRHPWMKLTATYQDTHPEAGQFTQLADGYLADVDAHERQALARHLATMFEGALQRYGEATPGGSDRGGRTPELGSLKVSGGSSKAQAAPVEAAGHRGHAAYAEQASKSVAPPVVETATPVVASLVASAATTPDYNRPVTQVAVGAESYAPSVAAAPSYGVKHRPAFPFIDIAADAGAEALRGAKEGARQATFKALLKYALVAGLLAGAFWMLVVALSPHWTRSGSVYSDQLRKFAPHLENRTAPSQGQGD